jgi:hypothetical protein
VKHSEIDSLVAPFENLATPTPRGILTPGSKRRDRPKLVRPKRAASHAGTLADEEVRAALNTVREAMKRHSPAILSSFTTNAAILRAALLAYARDFNN